jgi:hypothetical protein
VHQEFRAGRFRRELRTVARHPSRIRWQHVRRAAATLYGLCSLPVDHFQLERLGRASHGGVTLAQRKVMLREAAAQPTPQ